MVAVAFTLPVEQVVPRDRKTETQPFGWWLKHQLDTRDMNQSEFARKAGVSTSMVSDWVNGRRTPSIQSAQAIADALDTTVEVVLMRLGLDPRATLPAHLDRIDGLLRTVEMTPDRRIALESLLQGWADFDRSRRD